MVVAVGIVTALVVLRTRPQASRAEAAPVLDPLPADGPAFENLSLDLLDPELAAALDAESDDEHDFGLPFDSDPATLGVDVEGY